MNDPKTPLDEMKVRSSRRGKDPRSRRLLKVLLILWLLTLAALLAVSWNAYFDKKEQAETLAQQIGAACETGEFGPGVRKDDQTALCDNAEKVIKEEDISEGVPGPQGPQGVQGIQGIPGPLGPEGPAGPRGLRGLLGLDGQDGRNGASGEDGANGADGEVGPAGPEGPPGPPGSDGADGTDGAQGPPGPEGPRGPTGVVNIEVNNCGGPVLQGPLQALYDETTQTITISCG